MILAQVLHRDESDEWTLLIRFANKADAGTYECQVNSDPKIMRKVTLVVRGSFHKSSNIQFFSTLKVFFFCKIEHFFLAKLSKRLLFFLQN